MTVVATSPADSAAKLASAARRFETVFFETLFIVYPRADGDLCPSRDRLCAQVTRQLPLRSKYSRSISRHLQEMLRQRTNTAENCEQYCSQSNPRTQNKLE